MPGANAFLFEQFPLLRPAGGGAPGAVDHAMAGEFCRGGGHGTAPTDHTQNAEAVVTDEETASYVRVKCILK